MPDPMRRVERLRRSAKEIRAVAKTMADPAAKAGLLQVAEDYERMARKFEQRLRQGPDETD